MKVTYGGGISDWAVLYTDDDVTIGNDTGQCNNNSGISNYFAMLSQTSPISQQGSDYIFATNVPGIGISVAESYSSRYNPLRPYPSTVYWGGRANGLGFMLR